jgi:peptide methionine sulfoxide reductase msrA/msrB
MKLNNLTEEEKRVIEEKGTEAPGTGEYEKFDGEGVYQCRRCDAYLYRSKDKFDSNCGWPAFDDEIDGSVLRQTDSDGRRTEIICNRCRGHLGHVFEGENLTEKNVRHCVNSVSMKFLESSQVQTKETIYLAGGCFWCIEAVFKIIVGVLNVESGYAGGDVDNPTYEQVSAGNTGHAEILKIDFDPTVVSLEKILTVFFDSHDPTTLNRQGNDIGTQYRSAIYTTSSEQLDVVKNFIEKVQDDFSEPIVTEIGLLSDFGTGKFYSAEDYHQDYFEQNDQAPYCQLVIAPKVEKIQKKYFGK